MKRIEKRPDGTVIEWEGTAEEFREAGFTAPAQLPQIPYVPLAPLPQLPSVPSPWAPSPWDPWAPRITFTTDGTAHVEA